MVILRPGKDALKIGLSLYFLFLKLSIDIKLAHEVLFYHGNKSNTADVGISMFDFHRETRGSLTRDPVI